MLGSLFQSVWSILLALLVMLFMITIHEFGHYIVGKKFGFQINEFSIGFGPAIYKRKMKTGEDFSIRALPLGGYCAFEEDEEKEGCFSKQKPWKRILVLIAGAFTNFIVTVLIVILTYSISGEYLLSVGNVLPNNVGETVSNEYFLQEKDIILSVNGKDIYFTTDLTNQLSKATQTPKEKVQLTVIRNGEEKNVEAYLRNYVYEYVDEFGENQKIEAFGLGILQSSELYRFPFFRSVKRSFIYCGKMAGEVLGSLGQIITGGIKIEELSGPVSTISITAQYASMGFRALIEIVSLIGVNLAVFNLLPIPALDGCKVLFTLIEMITKKKIDKRVEGIIDVFGLMFLLGFAVLVDLLKVL